MSARRGLPAQALARDAAQRRAWLGGFNLLPYRQRDARLARRRGVAEFAGAVGFGFVCAALVCAVQAAERVRLDGQRAAIETQLAAWAPRVRLAETAAHAREARLTRERAAVERARPLARLVALLDVLRALDYRTVMLLALRHAGDRAELEVRAHDPAAARRWLERLRERRPEWRIEMSGVKAAADAPLAAGAPKGAAALRFAVRIRWPEPAAQRQTAQIGGAHESGGRG
ncbi:pilus assembly protein PilN [Burkholderia sp. 3C]